MISLIVGKKKMRAAPPGRVDGLVETAPFSLPTTDEESCGSTVYVPQGGGGKDPSDVRN